MAVPIAKLTVIVGAGVFGSILSKEGNLSSFTDFFSGALKIVTKHLRQDNSKSQPNAKPQTDSLIAQVNNLRQELQSLTISRPVTIVTGSRSGSGASTVAVVVVVGVVAYGFIWWKGWKLSDMMFVTRRSMSDATDKVGKQLDLVSSSITSAKRHLSSRIDRVDCSLEDCKEVTIATKDEVSKLQEDITGFHVEVEQVHHVVKTLEAKLGEIELIQDATGQGVDFMFEYAQSLQRRVKTESIQGAASSNSRPALEFSDTVPVTQSQASSTSRLALELPQTSPVTRMGSLPPPSREPPTPSNSAEASTPKVLRTSTVSISGLKELQEVSNGIRTSAWTSGTMTRTVSEVSSGTPSVQEPAAIPSSSGFWGKIASLSLLTRSRSTGS